MLHQLIIFFRRYINRLIKIPLPTLFSGEGELAKCPSILHQLSCQKPLIVSDKTLGALGIISQLTDRLTAEKIDFVLFDQVTPDPTIADVNLGVTVYHQNLCDGVIALGGGSVMDCAKAILASTCKNKEITALAGLFKIRKNLAPFIAVPTTAGTGSETTLVAVISDPVKKQKFTVIDPSLVPKVAIIDPVLMLGLPNSITAETGMDALTHAIESYIGKHSTPFTKANSLDAIKAIFKFLPVAYNDGKNIDARTEMSIASYKAGIAFTRTSIGYVHAIAHQLGGFYHIPHGLANAVLLPYVLDFSFNKAYKKYAELAIEIGVSREGDSEEEQALKFITAVNKLSEQLNIQKTFEVLAQQDIHLLAKRAIKEAYCQYPVPKQMTVHECESILSKLL